MSYQQSNPTLRKRNLIFKIHSIAGLFLGIFILLMSLSGAVLVFHEELDKFQYPGVAKSLNTPIKSIDDCYRLIRRKYPSAEISNCNWPRNNEPCTFTIYDPSFQQGTAGFQVFVDPVHASVLSTRGLNDINNIMGWVSGFHSSFHLGKIGEWLTGFFALVFLISIITGFFLYRKNILPALLFSKTTWKKNNLHQLIGVYALIFNLLIGFSGFWMQRYVFKKDFYQSSSYTPLLKTSPDLFFNMDSAYKKALEKFPGFEAHVVYFAQNSKGKTAIYGSRKQNSFIHSKKYADAVFLDSMGKISRTAFVTDINPSDRFDIINAQIHYGKYGGLPVQIIYFVLGLTGAILSITGFRLWMRRKAASC